MSSRHIMRQSSQRQMERGRRLSPEPTQKGSVTEWRRSNALPPLSTRGTLRFVTLIGAALILMLLLPGCASNYEVVPCPEPTPVPASLLRPHSQDANAYSEKVSSFLTRVETYSAETGRTTTP